MSSDIRYPNITAKTDAGKIQQLQSYLYQIVGQLNWALSNIEQKTMEAAQKSSSNTEKKDVAGEAQSAFAEIKSLIIKSADIVNSYYDKINARLVGIYVAQSDFGVYSEKTAQEIEVNSTAIEQFFTDLQQIISDIDSVENTLIEVNAHIKSGLLYYDENNLPVYGLEIGQRSEVDGEEVFNKYARFTSDKLSFYDSNDNEVAYISDKKLYITHVEVTGSFTLGGFVDTVLSDKSIVTKWVVGGDG